MGVTTFLNDSIIAEGRTLYHTDPDGLGNITEILRTKQGVVDRFSYRVDQRLTSFERAVLSHVEDRPDRSDQQETNGLLKVAYYYDALGRRVAKKINRDDQSFIQSFSYLGGQDRILMARSGNGQLTLYLDGQGVDEHLAHINKHEVRSYVTDHLGSVLNSVVVGKVHVFSPWGEIGGRELQISPHSEPVRYAYAGRQFDAESGLYYNRARYYDPESGRFLTKDPIGLLGGINPYIYVFDDPTRYVDPSGECLWYLAVGLALATVVLNQVQVYYYNANPPPLPNNNNGNGPAIGPDPSTQGQSQTQTQGQTQGQSQGQTSNQNQVQPPQASPPVNKPADPPEAIGADDPHTITGSPRVNPPVEPPEIVAE